MKKIKAIIFDLDGTLVDSEYLHFSCWNQVLSQYNIKLDYDYYIKNCAGTPAPATSETLIKNHKLDISVNDLAHLKEKVAEEKLRTEDIQFMPNALTTLEYFYQLNIPMFLVTGSPMADVAIIFERTPLKKYFEFLITRTDVTYSKPHPESYLKAIEKSNINPENILVFEDTKSGVDSAKSANLKCFAIQKDSELHDKLAAADEIFENFDLAIQYLEKENLL